MAAILPRSQCVNFSVEFICNLQGHTGRLWREGATLDDAKFAARQGPRGVLCQGCPLTGLMRHALEGTVQVRGRVLLDRVGGVMTFLVYNEDICSICSCEIHATQHTGFVREVDDAWKEIR